MALLYQFFMGLWSDAVLFAIKAGLLTVALSLPSLIKSSAGFAYGTPISTSFSLRGWLIDVSSSFFFYVLIQIIASFGACRCIPFAPFHFSRVLIHG